MLVKTRAVVVKSIKLGDNHRMITAISEDMGKISFKACGVNSMRNKNTASCNMFTFSEFILRQKGELLTLDKGSVLLYPFKTSCDIPALSLAAYFSQLCADTSFGNESSKEIGELLLNALFILAKNDRPTDLVKAVFELRLLSLLGFSPFLGECSSCGKKSSDCNKMYFDPLGGDLLCPDCRVDGRIALSSACVEMMRRACTQKESTAYAVKMSDSLLAEFSFAAENFLLNQLEKRYDKLDYYKRIKS